jgi:LuxR family transcriptional regulator, maltose regulon positive regulatory protein
LSQQDTQENTSPAHAAEAHELLFFESKLHVPQVRREWVVHQELVDTLIASRDKSMILIDGPVGYGKTTLVAQWNAMDTRPFAWVTLDRQDNDPTRFWTYVIEALRRVGSTVGAWTGAVPTSKESLQNDFLPSLLSELAESTQPIVLVLDDYHHIKNGQCHELTILLLDNLPPSVQLVVSSRADPPLRVSRRRVEGSLFEVRAADLRFSYRESDELLSQVLDRKLDSEQVRALADKTEGWPAALYLAAVSLRNSSDPDEFIEDFTGTEGNIADYLTNETLNRLPNSTRRFLLRTSILGRFSAGLCDEILESNESSAMIDDLEHSNLLVVSLDEHREWYRYHQLFSDLLRSELYRTHGTFVRELHRRASGWFGQKNLVSEAVHHANEAGDRLAVRNLISSNWYPYLNAGRLETVHSWLSVVGQDEIAADPVLSLTAAWCSALEGNVEEAKRWVANARLGSVDGPIPDGARSLESGIVLVTAMFGLEGVSVAIDDARRALELEPDPGNWRSVALTALGCYSYLNGDLEDAQASLSDSIAPNHLNHPVLEFVSRSELALVSSDLGDKARARMLAEEARQIMKQHRLSEIPQSSLVHLARGRVAADAGNLHEARELLEAALALRDRLPQVSPWVTLQLLLEVAPVRFALGDRKGARDLVRKGRAILADNPDAGALPERLRRMDRSLGRSSQRPALFGEPLTDRELAVLRLLPSRLTHREIANELYVSLNTIKSHVRAIYRKMNVSSRPSALDKARELELI